ncbi:uncharacterized protein LOC106758386 isoform X1 [Vigna radiata var. radiata]|uniref:Uncharacterized protein LOC106758386 isoform X1 n=1 Tax=Vigna radiata var. radiata TaxID=3916 RepID=A0A1S3TSN3_VIGRR|nr:uncharacterized protein LOC106758386 isoform X1 [Vigna radiata var. radiata]
MEKMKAAVAPPSPSPSKKRQQPMKKRSISSNAQSTYVKIRGLLKDVRPYIIEALKTPDFKKCEASREVEQKLKMINNLYENLQAEGLTMKGKQLKLRPSGIKLTPPSVPSGIKLTPPSVSGSQKLFRDGLPETYIVGGSIFGWNFITFMGKQPVYYGKTKEEHRAGRKVSK